MTYSNYTRTTNTGVSRASYSSNMPTHSQYQRQGYQNSDLSTRQPLHAPQPRRQEKDIYVLQQLDNYQTNRAPMGGMRRVERMQDFNVPQYNPSYVSSYVSSSPYVNNPDSLPSHQAGPSTAYTVRNEATIYEEGARDANNLRSAASNMREDYPIGVIHEAERQVMKNLKDARDRELRHRSLPYPPANSQPDHVIRGFNIN